VGVGVAISAADDGGVGIGVDVGDDVVVGFGVAVAEPAGEALVVGA